MAHWNDDRSVCINTTQGTQKFLELQGIPNAITYVQFGKAKRRKQRPRIVINKLQGLRNTRNKLVQHQLLTAQGIRVPKLMQTFAEAVRFMEETGTPVVAKRINSSRARGIAKLNTLEDLLDANPVVRTPMYYFQEFVQCNREWRIHISGFHEEEVVAYRKCLLGDVALKAKETGDKPWVRNLDTCYFKMESEEDKAPWFGDIVKECRRAIDVLGMDIAGFDVGENNKVDGGEFYIYEANSACGMEEYTRSKYQTAINDIIQIKAREQGLL